MPDTPSIAKIAASLQGDQLSPEGLRIELDVNSFPTVSANVAQTDGPIRVAAPISDEVIERMAELQRTRLAGREEADFIATLEDGIGGELHYEGLTSAPILELTKVNTSDKIASVGMAALLDSLDMSIYRAGYVTERRETAGGDGPQIKPIPAARDGDVPGTLRGVTDVLVENFDVTLAGESLELTRQLLTIQHEINTGPPLQIWHQMLDNSDVRFASWEEAFRRSPYIARQLTEKIREAMAAQTPGFWNKVTGFMSAFQMFYVPEINGAGFFRRTDVKVGEPEGMLEVSSSGVSVADGSPRILQPGGVVMMSRAAPAERRETESDPVVPRIVAFAPSPLRKGFIHRETPPFWLVREDGIPIIGSEVDRQPPPAESGGRRRVNLGIRARRARRRRALTYKREVDVVSSGVMTELCEVIFKEIQLAHSTAGLTMPLNFSVTEYLGKRVAVKVLDSSPGGGGEFTGFVDGITHSVDLQQGKHLNSYTQIRLTHTKFE